MGKFESEVYPLHFYVILLLSKPSTGICVTQS